MIRSTHSLGGDRPVSASVPAIARRACIAACGVLSLALLPGCATQDYPGVSVSEANTRAPEALRLQPGDKLRVTVYDEPSLTGEYEVGASGSVTMPLIADVTAANTSPQQMADAVAAKLSQGGYVLNPRVAVDVLAYRPFYILGEVNKPGEYTYAGEISLLQAIAKAGGFTARANKGDVVVQRKVWGGGRKVPLGDPGLIIMPGDTITVRESLL
ncbi:polysaccharide biosynthesis/export family protein [Novosphingobium kaempferiae]|uniref:polysaccharide biosynthesis/export family protein n=1 Tax=Novosphingobium kaempferiae TaxID=2896849 RepID=UPI001E2D4136|nr:polysaccharide biosynthesis/export family protein [Novosphingobium kaempferiae]